MTVRGCGTRGRLALVTGVAAMVLIALPAVAAAAVKTSMQFAGFAWPPKDFGTSLAVKSTIVVPQLKCGSAFQGVTAEVGLAGDFGNKPEPTLAQVLLGCYKGQAYYFPEINLNSVTSHQYQAVKFHPGDTVVLTVSENTKSAVVSVKDVTRKNGKTLTGGGASQVGFPQVGNGSQNISSGPLPVPNFGTVHFSGATVNGQSLASFTRYNRVNGGTLQIQTSPLGNDQKSFSTVYQHS